MYLILNCTLYFKFHCILQYHMDRSDLRINITVITDHIHIKSMFNLDHNCLYRMLCECALTIKSNDRQLESEFEARVLIRMNVVIQLGYPCNRRLTQCQKWAFNE